MYIPVQLCVNHITWNFWSYQNCEDVTCDCILTHTSNSELQWNPRKISQLTKFAHLRNQNNLVPKYSHMINTYTALLICFPLKSISHLTCIKISWCKQFFNHLIYSCIKIPSVKFVPNKMCSGPTSSDSVWLFTALYSSLITDWLALYSPLFWSYITLSLALYISPFQYYIRPSLPFYTSMFQFYIMLSLANYISPF